MQKSDFFRRKMATISRNLEHLDPFRTAFRDHLGYVCAKYHRDLCIIEGARCVTKISVHILYPNAAAAAQSNQKHIGPHFHVGPDKNNKTNNYYYHDNVSLTVNIYSNVLQ